MPNLPTLPETFETPYSLPTEGTTYRVGEGEDLQAVIDAASLGDVIVLKAGVTYTGVFKLPAKTGSGWVYIISSELKFLPEGCRVHPSDAARMPKIAMVAANNLPCINIWKNAHHYRFAGIELIGRSIDPITGFYAIARGGYESVSYSDGVSTWTPINDDASLASYITFDRCYVHNLNVKPKFGRCGVQIAGHYIAVIDSYISGITDTSDAQAIWIYNGGGPYKFVNNYLEASGENIMIGGTDPKIPNAVPSDIEFRGNYCYKQSVWGANWTIKNLFELKNAQRVLCTGNILENCFKDDQGQGAQAFALTPRNQNNTAPWSVVQDITITNNKIRSCGKGFNIPGEDDLHPSEQTKRILIENNLIEDLSQAYAGSSLGISLSTPNRPALDVTIRHNLLLHNGIGNIMMFLTAPLGKQCAENFVCENNIMTHAAYGLFGNGVGTGTIALTRYAPINYSWQKNVIIMRPVDRDYVYWLSSFAHLYPANNSAADGESSVGFTNFSPDFNSRDYTLTANSPYKGWGLDGKDPGPDCAALKSATIDVKIGQGVSGRKPLPRPKLWIM